MGKNQITQVFESAKKYLIISFLLIISIISISSISAAEDMDHSLLEDNSIDETVTADEGVDEIVGEDSSTNNEEITSGNDQGTIQATTGSFSELRNLINSQSTVNLSQDYEYKSSDSLYKKGIVINKKVTIDGNGHVIYCYGNRVFNVTSNGELTLKNVILMGDLTKSVNEGGAIYIQGGKIDLINCSILKFAVYKDGGAIWNNGTVNIQEVSAINQSMAENRGGGIMNYGKLTILGTNVLSAATTYFYNNAAKIGGAIYNLNEVAALWARFNLNQALNNTGAVYNSVNDTKKATILQCLFNSNFAAEGSDALYNCYVHSSYLIEPTEFTHTGVFMIKGLAYNSANYNTHEYSPSQFINVTIGLNLGIENVLTNFTEGDIGIVDINIFDIYKNYEGIKVIFKYTINGQTQTLEKLTDSNGHVSFDLGELLNGTYIYNAYIDDTKYTAIENGTGNFTVKKLGSFTELASLINSKSSITLTTDYTFKVTDSEYKTGIPIAKKITINGNGHTIYCKDARVFNLFGNADVTLRNLMIYGINANTFEYGGGILVQGGQLTINNCILRNLSSKYEGGAIWNNGTLIITNYTGFYFNSIIKTEDVDTGGGAIINYGILYAYLSGSYRVVFYNNTADFGGAIDNENQAQIEYAYFYYNNAKECGGAVYNNLDEANKCIIQNSVLEQNTAGDCAGALKNCFAWNCTFLTGNDCPNEGKYMLEGMAYNSGNETINYNEPYYSDITIVTDLLPTNNPDYSPQIIFTEGDDCIVNILVSDNVAKYSGIKVILRYSLNGQVETLEQNTDSNGIASFNLGKLPRGVYEYFVYTNSTNYAYWEYIYSNITVKKDLNLNITNLDISDIVNMTVGDVLSFDVKAIDINNPDNIVSGARIILNFKNTTSGYDFYQAYTDDEGIAHFNIKDNLTEGVHEVLITVKQFDNTYSSGIIGFNVNVEKVKDLIITANKVSATYGTSTNLNIKVTNNLSKVYSGLKIIIKLVSGGKTKTYSAITNANGVASFNTKSLDKGNYVAHISIGNASYIGSPITSSVKITQKALTISPKVKNTAKGPSLMITVTDKSKRLNGIKIKLLVYTGKKYKTINLVTGKISGKAGMCGMITNMFNKGKHKVVIQINSPNYKGKKTTYITITKKHKTIRNYYTYYTNGKKITKKL